VISSINLKLSTSLHSAFTEDTYKVTSKFGIIVSPFFTTQGVNRFSRTSYKLRSVFSAPERLFYLPTAASYFVFMYWLALYTLAFLTCYAYFFYNCIFKGIEACISVSGRFMYAICHHEAMKLSCKLPHEVVTFLIDYECQLLYCHRLRNVRHLSRRPLSLDLWIQHFTSITKDACSRTDNKSFPADVFIIESASYAYLRPSRMAILRNPFLTQALNICLVKRN
jgi:hypothetical protein